VAILPNRNSVLVSQQAQVLASQQIYSPQSFFAIQCLSCYQNAHQKTLKNLEGLSPRSAAIA
jgi:hypothetical protein